MTTTPKDKEEGPAKIDVYTVLRASGVPTDHGRLKWPLGLQILAARETDELRDQVDALFQLAAFQTAYGQPSADLLDETGRAVNKLSELLMKDKDQRLGMPLAVYAEAEKFLGKLKRAQKILQIKLVRIDGEPSAPRLSSDR